MGYSTMLMGKVFDQPRNSVNQIVNYLKQNNKVCFNRDKEFCNFWSKNNPEKENCLGSCQCKKNAY